MTWQLASFLILGLALALGFAWYERSRPPARVLALVAALAALAVVGRLAFAPLPNVKPTTDIVLFAGYALGGAPGFAVGAVTALVSNIFLSHGPWTPWQMAAWGGVGVAGGALGTLVRGRWRLAGRTEVGGEPRELGRWPLALGRWPLALACGLAGLGFGVVMDLYLWTLGAEQTGASYVAIAARSLPFNVAHIVGNVVFCLLIGPPLVRALRRYRRRFEVRWAAPGTRAVGSSTAVVAVALTAVLASLGGAPAAQADSASNQAFRYLLGSQNRDGGFGPERGSSSAGTQTGEVALGLAAAGRNPHDVSNGGNSIIDWTRRNIGGVRTVGGVERTILVLRAAGTPRSTPGSTRESMRRFAGRNLYAELRDYQGRDGSFGGSINHAAYGVLALRAAGANAARVRRSAEWLEDQQNKDDGGFGISANAESGSDYTGAALSALAAAGRGGGREAQLAVGYLEDAQNASGGFGLEKGASSNAQSTAWSVQGLVAVRRGRQVVGTALAYLRRTQKGDGSVPYDEGGGSKVWATGQAVAALKRQPFPIDPVARRPVPPKPAAPTGQPEKNDGDDKATTSAGDDRPANRVRRPSGRGPGRGPGNRSGAGAGPGSGGGGTSSAPGSGTPVYPIGSTATPFGAPPFSIPGLSGSIGAAGALAAPGGALTGALPSLPPSKPKTPGQLFSDARGQPSTPVAASKPLGPKKDNPAPRIGAGALLVVLVGGGLLLATGGGARARRLWASARRRTS